MLELTRVHREKSRKELLEIDYNLVSMRLQVGMKALAVGLAVVAALGATSVVAGAQRRPTQTPPPVFKHTRQPPLSLLIATNQLEAGDTGTIVVRVAQRSSCALTFRGPSHLAIGPVRATLHHVYATWEWKVRRGVHGGLWKATVTCEYGAHRRATVTANLLVAVTQANDAPIVAPGSMKVRVSTALPDAPGAPSASHVGKGGGGYPNDGALCEWTGKHNGPCPYYDWGYLLPSGRWSLLSSRGFAYRNCTDFVAWFMGLTWSSFHFPAGKGNAVDWKAYAGHAGLQVTSVPSVGDIAWWGGEVGGGYGHVAIVTAVDADGSVTIAEYNGDGQGDYDLRPEIRADAYLHRRGTSPAPTPTPTPAPTPTPTPSPAPTPGRTYAETSGGVVNTWSNYADAGGTEGPAIPAHTTIQVTCRTSGFTVADGNSWWYLVASSPWSDNYYASADAFYNNGQTSGSLQGTPYFDPNVQTCNGAKTVPTATTTPTSTTTTSTSSTTTTTTPSTTTTSTSTTTTSTSTTTTSTTQPPVASQPTTYAETVGGVTHTWADYEDAGGTEGSSIAAYQTVQVTCAVQGFRVADGDTWWYKIASSPWNNTYYASADAFYNNGQTSGSLIGTPFVDPAVPQC